MDWIFIVTMLGGALAGAQLLRMLFPYAKSTTLSMYKKLTIDTRLNKLIDNVEFLTKELKPNGGSSLRDVVDGLRKDLDRLASEISSVNAKQLALVYDYDRGIFECDAQGNTIFVNRHLCRLMDRTPEEFLGSGWVNAIAEEDREDYVEAWYKAASQQREFNHAFRTRTPTGVVKSLHCKSYVLRNSKHQVTGYLGMISVNDK